jgi:hypothetical protein
MGLTIHWDLEFEGRPVPLNKQTIGKLPPEILIALYEKYDKITGIDQEEMGK